MVNFTTKHINLNETYFVLLDFSLYSLGRSSSSAASIINGKFITHFAFNKRYNVKLYIINSPKLVLTGKKEKRSWYRYKNSLKTISLDREINSEWVVRHSISGMLNKNKTRKFKEKNIIFIEDKEIFSAKFNNFKNITSDVKNYLTNSEMVISAHVQQS